MFASRPNPRNADVAARLADGQRLALLSLTLNVHAPASGLEAPLASTIDVALVAIKITTGVSVIRYRFQV